MSSTFTRRGQYELEDGPRVETKSAQAGWTSAVGRLAVHRLAPSEKEIHFAVMSVANAKLAPTSDIAFHVQPAEALFVGAHHPH